MLLYVHSAIRNTAAAAAYIFMPRLSAIIQRSCDVLVHVQVGTPPLSLSLSLFVSFCISLSLSLFVPLFPTLLLYLSLCVCVRLIADVYSEFESM